MARKSTKSTGRLAMTFAIVLAITGLLGGLLLTVALVQNLAAGISDPEVISRGWKIGFGMAALAAAIAGGAGWVLGSKTAGRITDIALAVGKLGRGGSEVKVRVGGTDEVAALGRSVQ